MVYLETTCPFCITNAKHKVISLSQKPKNKDTYVSVIIKCASCDRHFIGTTQTDDVGYSQLRNELADSTIEEVYTEQDFEIFPKAEFYIHPSFPDKVKSLIKELYATRDSNVAVMCARVILEYTLKDIGIGTDKDPLYERIQKAYERQIITKPVADWAHIVRKFGNVAIHDVEATEVEANEVKEFTKIFLDLVYRIPYEISKFQK